MCIIVQLKEAVVLEAATVRLDTCLSVLLDQVAHVFTCVSITLIIDQGPPAVED